MARIRTIKPDFFTSEDIMALSPLARLLYIGTWLDADRQGRLSWKPNTLKVRYLPSDDCDIQAVAAELLERGLIVLYGDGLSYIPTFLEHQVINPRESKSNLPDPKENTTSRVSDASLRVSDAPSFLPIPSPSIPSSGAAPIQGRGASEAGSLPRDHMRHAMCGPAWKVCLALPWQKQALVKQYNHPDPKATDAALVGFLEVLEKSLTPENGLGGFDWIEKNFQQWLKSVGRGPSVMKLSEVKKPFTVQDAIDRDNAKKAARAAGQ
jgi:hypothetical protein